LVLSGLVLTSDDALDTFRSRRAADPELDLEHLKRARDILGVIGTAITSSSGDNWKDVERAWEILCGDGDESAAPAQGTSDAAAAGEGAPAAASTVAAVPTVAGSDAASASEEPSGSEDASSQSSESEGDAEDSVVRPAIVEAAPIRADVLAKMGADSGADAPPEPEPPQSGRSPWAVGNRSHHFGDAAPPVPVVAASPASSGPAALHGTRDDAESSDVLDSTGPAAENLKYEATPFEKHEGKEVKPPPKAVAADAAPTDFGGSTFFLDGSGGAGPSKRGALPFSSKGEADTEKRAAAKEKKSPTLPFSKVPEPRQSSASATRFPTLTLEQYASLCAECAVDPARRDETHKRYQIHLPADREQLDAHWDTRFEADAALRTKFETHLSAYMEWLRSSSKR